MGDFYSGVVQNDFLIEALAQLSSGTSRNVTLCNTIENDLLFGERTYRYPEFSQPEDVEHIFFEASINL
jgi:hypothetical protein